jgi:hypothetical protein
VAMLLRLRYRALVALIACLIFLTMFSVGIAQTPGSVGDVTADLVLGEINFTLTNSSGSASNQTFFRNPQSVAIDNSTPNRRVYVAIPDENRVLGWDDAAGLTNGVKADLVIGQTNFLRSVTDCSRRSCAVLALTAA